MSGHGKRSLSPQDLEAPLAKRQRLEEPDTAREGITHEHVNTASDPAYTTQNQPIYHPQATPAQHGFQPQPLFQPQHVFQPRHGFQPQPIPCTQPPLQHQPISGNNSSGPNPDDKTADNDSAPEDDDQLEEETGSRIPSEAKGKRRASSPAPEEPNTKKGPSARSQKRAGMINPGRDDRERDQVEEIGGQLFWRDPQTGEFRKAVYHNDIRAELIAAASLLGEYTYERRRGTREHDETAFHPEQRDWTPERQHWSRIRDNVLNIHKKADYKGKYYRRPVERIWEHTDGRVILDKDNHPVRKIPDLPATLSSEVEGWYLEVLTRLDNRILRRDFWARLPHARGKSRAKSESNDIFGLSALGNRRGRWRVSEGLISWKSRIGSKELNEFLRTTISQESLDRNSNEGGRTLTPEEVKYAEAISERKKAQKDKASGQTPASKQATPEKDVTESPKPQSEPGRTLLPGFPDPTSPSLERQPRPLSALLAGTERAEENARLEDLLGNTNSGDYYDFSLDPIPGPGHFDQPPEDPRQIPGASDADLIKTTPGLDGPGSNDPVIDEENFWDESQQQLWNSLVQENLAAETANHGSATGTSAQDGWRGNPFGQDGQGGWYQSNYNDAANAAMQTRHQMRQQQHLVFDQIDNHAGQNGSAPESDPFRSLFQDQRWSANGADNLQSPLNLNNTNRLEPSIGTLVAGTDMQQTTNSGSEIPQNGGNPVRNGQIRTQTLGSETGSEFAGRQMNTQTSSGRQEQTAQSTTRANGPRLPPHIDLTGDSPGPRAQQRLNFLTAMYNSPHLAQADEQAMRILNGTAPTSSHPVAHPTAAPAAPAHPPSSSNPPPSRPTISTQPTSSPTPTAPSNQVEPHNIIPTTRLHHAILWRLFKPTREAFKAAFRDDAWRPYVARDFVPTIEEPMSYMGILNYMSGEFWRVWTARYGFEGQVPGLVGPRVIDAAAARALRGGE